MVKYSKALVVALGLSVVGWTNGAEFFQPAKGGKVDLVYFGFIKDTRGNLIRETAIIKVESQNLDMHFDFMSDKPGHYRSPDIGAYHREMGMTVDPATMSIEITVPGYRQVRPGSKTVPQKTKGAINIDFVMEKLSGNSTN